MYPVSMTATLEFHPEAFSEAALRYILRKAQEWSCTPAEALARILDEQAERSATTSAA